MLPVFYMPKEDEEITNYLKRLLQDNGIENIPSYFKRITNLNVISATNNSFPIADILKRLCIDEQVGEMFLRSTNYDLESIFLSELDQISYLSKVFKSQLVTPIHFDYRGYYKSPCPYCVDDFRKDVSSFKKIYKSNLNLYEACPYHQYNFSNPLLEDYYVNRAIYIKKIQDARLDLSRDETISFIGYKNLPKGYASDAASIMDAIISLYPDPEDFINAIPKYKVVLKKDKEYKILSKPKNNFIAFKHITCGTVFCMTAIGFNIGVKCPICTYTFKNKRDIKNVLDAYIKPYLI